MPKKRLEYVDSFTAKSETGKMIELRCYLWTHEYVGKDGTTEIRGIVEIMANTLEGELLVTRLGNNRYQIMENGEFLTGEMPEDLKQKLGEL